MILEDLLSSLDTDAEVRSVFVGAHHTCVCSRHCGLATSVIGDKPHHQTQIPDAGHLHLKKALDLAGLARSENLLEASIGVAAINSLLDVDESGTVEINAADVLINHGRGRKIVIVGHFPFIPRLRKQASDLWVLEKHPAKGEHPAEAAPVWIPQADVIAISGTALINHSLDDLLSLRRSDAFVMILGPSTPLSPILFEHGATVLSGSRVIDEAAMHSTLSQGASFRQIEGVQRLSIARDMKFLMNG